MWLSSAQLASNHLSFWSCMTLCRSHTTVSQSNPNHLEMLLSSLGQSQVPWLSQQLAWIQIAYSTHPWIYFCSNPESRHLHSFYEICMQLCMASAWDSEAHPRRYWFSLLATSCCVRIAFLSPASAIVKPAAKLFQLLVYPEWGQVSMLPIRNSPNMPNKSHNKPWNIMVQFLHVSQLYHFEIRRFIVTAPNIMLTVTEVPCHWGCGNKTPFSSTSSTDTGWCRIQGCMRTSLLGTPRI